MRKAVLAMAAVLLLSFSSSAQAGYRTEVSVTPASEANHYVVKFTIIQQDKDGKESIIAKAITLDVPVGDEEGGKVESVSANTDGKDSGYACFAKVKNGEDGLIADVKMIVKKDGEDLLNTSESIAVKASK